MDTNIFYDEMKNKINIMHNVLIDLKEDSSNKDKIDELFRAIHTIKGSADLLYLTDIVEVTHKVEDILTEIRDGNLLLDKNIIRLFIEVKDFLELVLSNSFEGISDFETIENLKVYFTNKIKAFLPKTILVLNETIDIKNKLETISGYNIVVVDNIELAKQTANNTDISLLFIDIETFYYDGLNMIKEFHTTDKYSYLPVVLIVSQPNKVLDNIRKKVGAKAWIKKPIDIEHLLFIIKKII